MVTVHDLQSSLSEVASIIVHELLYLLCEVPGVTVHELLRLLPEVVCVTVHELLYLQFRLADCYFEAGFQTLHQSVRIQSAAVLKAQFSLLRALNIK